MDFLVDNNAPVYDTDLDIVQFTQNDFLLAGLGPTIWLDMVPRMMVKSADGTFQYIVCRASGRKFVPINAAPIIKPTGSAAPLDFTAAAGITRAIFGELGEETLLGGRVYSIAALVKTTGGAIMSGLASDGNYPLLFADADNKLTWWSHLNQSSSWPANRSLAGGWKIVTISSDEDGFTIEVDGVGVSYPGGPQAISTAPNARKAVIGGASNSGTDFTFKGQQEHFSFWPGVTFHKNPAAKAAIFAHLNNLKEKMGGV